MNSRRFIIVKALPALERCRKTRRWRAQLSQFYTRFRAPRFRIRRGFVIKTAKNQAAVLGPAAALLHIKRPLEAHRRTSMTQLKWTGLLAGAIALGLVSPVFAHHSH